MGRIRQILAAVLVLVPLASARADAVTIRDVVELSKAGLSDDVLLALIEVDRPVFAIDTPTLKMLKESGVSQAVIIAMIRSGRSVAAQPPVQSIEPQFENAAPVPASPEPQVIVIDHHEQPIVREVAVPIVVPVFLTTLTPPRRHLQGDRSNSMPVGNDLSPRNSDLSPGPIQNDRRDCTAPVYWGFGGKLRPGSWQPPQVCR